MTYQEERNAEQLDYLNDEITHFISRYLGNLSSTNRKTVILFPGGMGSQLLRASTPRSDGPPYSYNIVWLDCSTILFGAGAHLRMQGDIDFHRHFVIADGPVDFPPLTPYQRFIDWCNQQQIDYLIFGWDWRRDLSLTADFFLNDFMPLFKKRVAGLYPNPLQRLSLVGHSQGGMLVKLILNRTNNAYVQLLKSAVTVASPFYGYGGQLPRYFTGDPDLNVFMGGSRTVTRIISSLAGGYTLLFLDWATFQRDGALLMQDPNYPLLNYPILDATNGMPADPYNPQTNGAQVRYPQLFGFDWSMLGSGKAICNQVAALLDPSINAKFFNIRCVTTNNNVDVNKTVTHQTWDWIDPDFDPGVDSLPITDYLGPGDDTLPAWSTRFVHTPAANVSTLHGDDIHHMFLMNNTQVFNQLLTVI